MEKVNALPALQFSGRLQSETQEELPPSLRLGDATQDALLPSILDKAFRPLQGAPQGELWLPSRPIRSWKK
jgi:hypothetical protein